MSHFRNWTVITVLMTVITQLSSTAIADDDPKVTKLLEQRRDVLRRVVQLHVEQYRQGELGLDSVLLAQRELLAAELELCKMADERIVLRHSLIKVAKDYEAIAKALFKSGDGTQADVLRANAMRLEAEIELIREVAAAKPKK